MSTPSTVLRREPPVVGCFATAGPVMAAGGSVRRDPGAALNLLKLRANVSPPIAGLRLFRNYEAVAAAEACLRTQRAV